MTNREKFTEIFGCEIAQHDTSEAIPGHCKILIASDKHFNEWLKQEYVQPSAQPVAKDINVPVKDCISRQAALSMYFSCGVNYDGVVYVPLKEIKDNLEALPSAQPGWIPCKTALPKDEEEVIVSIHDDSGDYACDYTSSGWYAAAGEFWVVDNEANMRVTAWQPMPKPWEGDEK